MVAEVNFHSKRHWALIADKQLREELRKTAERFSAGTSLRRRSEKTKYCSPQAILMMA
jgi:hypothetical protein